MSIVSNLPFIFYQGDYVNWTDVFDQYLSPVWTATVTYNNADYNVSHVGIADSGGHMFTIDIAESLLFVPGLYDYQMAVSNGTQNFVIQDAGKIEVKPSLVGSAVDLRSHIEITLDSINLAIQARVSGADSMKFEVEGRSVENESLEELEALRSRYLGYLRDEQNQTAISQGRANSTVIRTRL